MDDDRHIEVVTTSTTDGGPRHHQMWFLWDEPHRLHLIWVGPEPPSWVVELAAEPTCEIRVADRRWEAMSIGPTAEGRTGRTSLPASPKGT
jgi:hypothetical protein